VAYFGLGSTQGIAGISWFPLPLKNAMSGILRSNKLPYQILLGMLNGLLPCGLVYMAVAGAIATGNSWNGALFMIFFGFGTVPAMVALPFALNGISWEKRLRLRKFVPAFLLLIGMLFVVRGLNLGIPYLSPKISYEVSAGNGCHN
jgi:sulfite exporter TauE/SafE